jgi:acetyl esterase/lipase
VASINYRLSQHARFPGADRGLQGGDPLAAGQRREYNLDPDRFGAWGSSAGGHLGRAAGHIGRREGPRGHEGTQGQSSRVQAVVDWFGPTDVTRMGGSHDGPDSPEAKLLGGPVQENKEKAARANPSPMSRRTTRPS